MHLVGTEGDAGKMRKVMPMRANMQRRSKADMKMQEAGGGVHLGGTEGRLGLRGLTRCH